MDKLEMIKENVQPLKSGRKIETLKVVLNMDLNETSKRDETKIEFENKLENTEDDEEQLEVYHNYVHWIEQNYPQGGKDANLKGVLEKCIQKFYNKDKFQNNEKLLSLFLKYTNILSNPLEFFNFFYKSGFGKKMAKFYTCWSYCFESQNNFKRAIKVIDAGIHNGAQPTAVLKAALSDLQVRTMRHAVDNPEDNEKDSQRKALNSLKAKVEGGRAEAPVKRVGNSVTSLKGLKNVTDHASKSKAEHMNILCVETEEPILATIKRSQNIAPIAELPLNNQENDRNPGKWNENKLNSKGLRKSRPVTNFEILEDDCENATEAKLPEGDIQPKPSISKSKETLEYPVARFEEQCQLKKYSWYGIMDQMYQGNVEYSFEELRYQKWVKYRQVPDTIKEESMSVSKSMNESSISETKIGATTMVRDFYNGTLTPYSSDQSHSHLEQSVVEVKAEPRSQSKQQFQIFSEATSNLEQSVVQMTAEPRSQSKQQFQIFSETTCNLNCTVAHKQDDPLPKQDVPLPNNEEEFQTKQVEFTISAWKEDEFQLCSASTPYVNKAFKRPENLTMKMAIHPNYVTGLTQKLSPIIETSRENNKSTSSSSGMSSTTNQTNRKLFIFPESINPFENSLRTYLLQKLSEPVEFRQGYSAVKSLVPSLEIAHTFHMDTKSYVPAREISSNFMIKVFMVFTEEKPEGEDYPMFTLKHCSNLNYWDFYIRDEISRRLFLNANQCNIGESLMKMSETVFYKNGYMSLHEGIPLGSLKEAIDCHSKQNKPFPECVMMYFIMELILIIRNFHECNIIHADICPENIFVFPDLKFDQESYGKKAHILRFCDFSKAVDMTLLPEGTVFRSNYTETKYLDILNSTDWTYLIDWLQLLNCIHQMCFATDLEVVSEDSKWKLSKAFERPQMQYLNQLFDLLLNLKPNQKPDLDLFIQGILSHLKHEVYQWQFAREYFSFIETIKHDFY